MSKIDQKITISKLDAAKRQLETVIRLYFSDGDPVSIHTLVAAAYNVVHDLSKKRGGPPMIVKDIVLTFAKPEQRDEVIKKLNKAESFFKHADRDHSDTLEFRPKVSETWILDACMHYSTLTGESPPLFKTYQLWFIAHYQDEVNLPDEHKPMFARGAETIRSMSRKEFFNTMVPLVLAI